MKNTFLNKLIFWPLSAKITFLFLFNAGIAIYIEKVGEHALHEIGEELHAITAEDMPLTKMVSNITVHQLEQAIHLERAEKYANIIEVSDYSKEHYKLEKEKFKKYAEKVDAEILTAERLIEDVLKVETAPKVVAEFERVYKILKRIKKEHKTFDEHAYELFEEIEKGNTKKAYELSKKIEAEEDNLNRELESVLVELESFTQTALETVELHEKEAEDKLREASIIGLILALLVSSFIIFGTAIPIHRLKSVLNTMAGGFSAKVPKANPRSEMGELLDAVARIGNNIDAINKTQAVIHFEMDGTIINANDSFLTTMGYELNEIIGKHHSMFAPPGLAESQEYKDFWANLNKGHYEAGEYQRVGKGGKEVWINASYNPILNVEGKPSRVTKFATDITKEMKQRHLNEMVSLVASETDNSVVITDADENIIYVNEGFTRLTGYTIEDCEGKTPGQLLQGKNTDPETRAEIRKQLDAREPFYNEILNYAKDGTPYWISLAINPVFNDKGELTRFVSIQGDVTANKKVTLENEAGMKESIETLAKVAKGDFSQKMTGDYKGTFSEIKTAINETIDKLISSVEADRIASKQQAEMAKAQSATLEKVESNAKSLSESSETLSSVANDMQRDSASTLQEANSVEAAAKEVSSNVSSVATSAEELSASVEEISKNAANAAQVGQNAVDVAARTSNSMNALGDSSQEIGNVIKTITSIAQQTNLLALNATIEAARAGEAGKGFAVVANEVKELAEQTTSATEEIGDKIEAIQHDTRNAVEAIDEICKIIGQINESQTLIASAVEEQNATVNEVARNAGEAAKGSVAITDNIEALTHRAESTSQGAGQTLDAAESLARLANNLNAVVEKGRNAPDRIKYISSSLSDSICTPPTLSQFNFATKIMAYERSYTPCPCGSQKSYESCCKVFHDGQAAPTAEKLMRSRYSAYYLRIVDYLVETTHCDTREVDLREQLERSAPITNWCGLTILSKSGGNETDKTGKVEFVAQYFVNGKVEKMHEHSRFKRYKGLWKYLDTKG